MNNHLLELLVDPRTRHPLRLDARRRGEAGVVIEGRLHTPDGGTYEIRRGIPRFVDRLDEDQLQTARSFGFKWSQKETYTSAEVRHVQAWIFEKYGFDGPGGMREYFAGRERILDAGCGGGLTTSLWMDESWGGDMWVGIDISSAIDIAQERLGSFPGTHFAQADIMCPPFPNESFDTIFCEGVLHHTPSPERALETLVRLLRPGGEVLFYVYRKKGPIREFADDYIRDALSGMDPKEAWIMLRPLTELGRMLSELNAEVEVSQDIPFLGIPAGRYDVQRLIYWHFLKLFWNPSLSLDENNHVNFDWYHPRYAHRQTVEEVSAWCDRAGIAITRLHSQESGFTVRGVKLTQETNENLASARAMGGVNDMAPRPEVTRGRE